YLANLARDPAVASPIQPGACAVSGIFCSILIFVIAYVRSRYPQMAFATVFAGMIGSFALTQNVATPGFKPSITVS
ncbi:uncharacterized protein B0P05DRAFT_469323, partial [Gilbertella persicaria]|uniref:uncharacterized protein n=1 Tax=Gilbertella persicaria TaxID=101096 RepID=UPI00221F3C88